MPALAVDLQLLRTVLVPDLKLAVGRELTARVAAVNGATGRGTLSLAGVLIDAQLPRALAAGQEVRLQVHEVTPDRVVLGLQGEAPAPPAVPVAAALPGGGAVHVTERDRGRGGTGLGSDAGGAGLHSLALRYDAPALGALDLHFVLAPDGLRLSVSAAAGAAHEAADEASDELRRALSEAVGLPVSVSVSPRYDPLDVYV